jgi:hypothetical protein
VVRLGLLLRRDHQNRSQSPLRRGSSVAMQAKRGACALFIARELGLPRLGFPNNVDSLCWQSDASSYVPMIRHWDKSADVGLDGAANRYQLTSASAAVWRSFIATRIRADRDGRNQTVPPLAVLSVTHAHFRRRHPWVGGYLDCCATTIRTALRSNASRCASSRGFRYFSVVLSRECPSTL